MTIIEGHRRPNPLDSFKNEVAITSLKIAIDKKIQGFMMCKP